MIATSPFPAIDIPSVTVPDFALRHAERLGPKPAFINSVTGECLTYHALATRIRAVAAGLHERGLRPRQVAGIWSVNCLEYVIAFHAVLTLGGIVSPVSAMATLEETTAQIRRDGMVVLVTSATLAPAAEKAAAGTTIRDLIVFGDAGVGAPFSTLLVSTAHLPEVAIDPAGDVAVILSSSGTTGPPKGVVYTHAGLVANGAVSAGSGSSRETDIFAGTSPFAHVAGMGLLLLSGLAVGLTTVLIPKFEAAAYLRTLREYQITYAAMSPPMLIALLNLPLDTVADFSAVRRVTSGAAPLSPELERAFNARFGVVVRQVYGMTEICPTHIMLNEAPAGKDGSVGQCLSNTECMIVSLANGTPLGPDEVGEVWLRGPQRMKGYLDNPAATAATIDAEGWVHTGDVGRVDRDGYLFIVDRLKELIKFKGYQVAPAELEAVLMNHPSVADVAVIRSPDAVAGEVPKAFVVLRSAVSADELMAFVAARVAHYKKVRRVEFIDTIPKSPSGKILRRELIERDRTLSSTLE